MLYLGYARGIHDLICFSTRKSSRNKKESTKYKDFDTAGIGKGKEGEGQKRKQRAAGTSK
jgi:hypothetical protein